MSDLLVGRGAELAALRELAASPARLLTVWGPPGIGKTSLVRHLWTDADAAFVAGSHVDGPASLAAATAAALDAGADPVDALRRLATSARWLCLDDLDVLVDAAAASDVIALVASWLAAVPALRIAITSRRRTRLPHEHSLVLDPLGTTEAADLFVRIVRRHRASWTPDADEAAALAPLVEALDGIPLAIELAAARWELLGTEGLMARLAQPLAVLAGPDRSDPRHAAIRTAIAGSWALLGRDLQAALAQLTAFQGTFDALAADAVLGGSALEALEALRDAALVQVVAPGRFCLLNAVRAFAAEAGAPADLAAARDRHADWLIATVDTSAPLPPLADDLHAATAHLLSSRDPRADRLLTALGIAAPGHHADLLDDAVAILPSPATLRARGRHRRLQGLVAGAAADFERGLALAEGPGQRGELLRELGVLHHGQRAIDEARGCYERALAAHIEAGDRRGIAITTGNLGALDHDLCHYEDAGPRYADAIAGLRAAGDLRTASIFEANQAVLLQEQGDLAGADGAYRRALDIQTASHDQRMQGITLGNLGMLQQERGDLPSAIDLYHRALAALQTVGDPASIARCRARLGAALAATGELSAGAEALKAAESQAAAVGDKLVQRLIALLWGFFDLAEGRTAAVADRLKIASIAPPDALPLTDIDSDARVAARLLQASLPGGNVIIVDPEGFVPPGGARQDLSRYASCRRMFTALVDRRLRAPSDPLSLDALFEAGWPGERIASGSVRNRVHVNLARLRSMGLKRVLVRTDSGYHLDPSVPIRTTGARAS